MALCLLTVGGGVVADAQIESAPPRIQANVAFAFVVGNTTLPAGKYEISRLDDTNPNTLELRSANGRTSVVFETEDAQTRDDQAASKTELVFDKVGDREFLSQIWVAGINSGRAVPKSRMEKRLDGGGSQAERHSIAAFLKHLKP
jgi:hypothetical protein